MKYRSALFAALAGVVAGAPLLASAQESGGDRRFYVSPMFSYVFKDQVRATDDGMGGALAIGKKFTDGLNLELIGFYDQADPSTGNGDAAKFTGGGLGAMIFPIDSMPWLYGLLSLYYGESQDSPAGAGVKDYSSTIFDSGLGALVPLFSSLSLRVEGRYRFDEHNQTDLGTGGDDKSFDGAVNVGLFLPLGSNEAPIAEEPPPPTEVVEAVAPADTDGDGVPDELDQCPDTPAGTAVDDKGCPLPPPAPACAPPAPGQPVTLEGCAAGDTIVLRGVTFNFNEATLTANAKDLLNGVSDALLSRTDINVEIGGHTDSRGEDAYNQNLSENRAKSVKAYLASRGVDAARMETRGYGESQPVESNDTDAGRELNRRVELKVISAGAAAPAEAAPAPEAAPAEAAAEVVPVEAAPEAAPVEAAPAEESAPVEAPMEYEPAAEAAPAEAPAEMAPTEPAAEAAPMEEPVPEATPEEVVQ